MASPTPGDPERLFEALRDDPQRLAELRTLLGVGDWERVAAALAELSQAQTRTEARLEALTERVDELAAAQVRTEARLEALTERVDGLAAAQRTTQEQLSSLVRRVGELSRTVTRLTDQVSSLTEQVSTLAGHVDWLRGDAIERRYRERGPAYFGPIAKGLAPLSWPELNEMLDAAVAEGTLSDDEAEQVRQADAVQRGRDREDQTELYLVVEASYGVGMDDVDRARERAELLARTGVPVVPVVAGSWFVPEADRAASAYGVWRVKNGQATAPAS